METWQKDHIRKNLPDLIFDTVCSHLFLAKLLADGLLSAEEVDILGTIKSQGEKSMKFYQIIQTRSKSFSSLKQALHETTQSGAYAILDDCSKRKDTSLEHYGSIAYDENELLGRGCSNTYVYKGKFEDRDVAVKVISNLDINKEMARNEIVFLAKLDWHENAVRYFKSEETKKNILIALELCDIDLHDWVLKPVSERKVQVAAEEIIYQATRGIQHLHENRVVHRDLKPANILLVRQATGAIRVKISDFGMARKLPDGKSKMSVHTSGVGTEGWMAPEVVAWQYQKPTRDADVDATRAGMGFASDIFSLGCVYYFILTNGSHPFGDDPRRNVNILDGNVELKEDKILSLKVGASDYIVLIGQMVTHDHKQRPSVHDVISQLPGLDKPIHVARQTHVQGRSNQPHKPIVSQRDAPSNADGQTFKRDADTAVPRRDEKPPASKPSSSVVDLVKKFNSNKFLIREQPSTSSQNKMGALETSELPIPPEPEASKGPDTYIKIPQVRYKGTQNPPKQDDVGSSGTAQVETYASEDVVKLKLSNYNGQMTVYRGRLADAIKAKDENAVRALVRQVEDVNGRDDKGRTMLQLAAESDDIGFALTIIKFLIDSGANPNETICNEGTFLHVLMSPKLTPSQFHNVALFLVSNKLSAMFDTINNNVCFLGCRTTPLHNIMKHVDVEAPSLSLLQKNGVDLNVLDSVGHSLLYYAIINKRSPRLLSDLVSLGANPAHIDGFYKCSYLHYAAQWGTVEHLSFFTNVGLDVNSTDTHGRTPLHYTAWCYQSKNILENIRFLINKGASRNTKDNEGGTPLDRMEHRISYNNFPDKDEALRLLGGGPI